MSRSVCALAIALAGMIAGQGPARSAGLHDVRYLMGTWCDLVIFDPDPDADAAETAFLEIARLQGVLSSWDPASEVSQLNASAGRGAQSVSADLASIAEESAGLCTTDRRRFRSERGAAAAGVGFLHRVAAACRPRRSAWPPQPASDAAA